MAPLHGLFCARGRFLLAYFMAPKILVVDDDADARKSLAQVLRRNAYAVLLCGDGSEALALAKESRPDLALTDVSLPGLDGNALCRLLKKDAATRALPVIAISGSRVKDDDVLAGFDSGVDDYVLKPFSQAVLLARVRAVLRRYRAAADPGERLKKRGIMLDPSSRTASVDGKAVHLTRKEFDLLAILISKNGRVLGVPYLLETVWGYDPTSYSEPHTVEVHVSQLRRKLGEKKGRRLVSVTGYGYKFEG